MKDSRTSGKKCWNRKDRIHLPQVASVPGWISPMQMQMQMQATLPTGLVTLLYADVEDSSKGWQANDHDRL